MRSEPVRYWVFLYRVDRRAVPAVTVVFGAIEPIGRDQSGGRKRIYLVAGTGGAGRNLFDTIDYIIRNVSTNGATLRNSP